MIQNRIPENGHLHCSDCYNYGLCEYYNHRKKTSRICREFVINKEEVFGIKLTEGELFHMLSILNGFCNDMYKEQLIPNDDILSGVDKLFEYYTRIKKVKDDDSETTP